MALYGLVISTIASLGTIVTSSSLGQKKFLKTSVTSVLDKFLQFLHLYFLYWLIYIVELCRPCSLKLLAASKWMVRSSEDQVEMKKKCSDSSGSALLGLSFFG